jgi:hypothetical protein
MDTQSKPPKNQKRFGTLWGELAYVCQKVHYWLHERHRRAPARRYQCRLEQVLGKLPKDDQAILREEGLALFHELKREPAVAAQHRKREIRLIEELQESVQKSVEAGHYDHATATSILAGRDAAALQKRREILTALEETEAQRRGDVMPAGSHRGKGKKRPTTS